MKRKQIVIDIIAAAALLFGGFIVVADKSVAWLHLNQYLFNIIFFVLVLPSCIAVTDAAKRLEDL